MSEPEVEPLVLGIDLATKCGWAVLLGERAVDGGTWDLRGKDKGDLHGVRWVRLRAELDGLYMRLLRHPYRDVVVAYEDVRGHRGTSQAQLYGGAVAVLQLWCEDRELPYMPIHTGTVKKHATGRGNAEKADMIAAAAHRWPGVVPHDDNHADALWVAEVARKLHEEAA